MSSAIPPIGQKDVRWMGTVSSTVGRRRRWGTRKKQKCKLNKTKENRQELRSPALATEKSRKNGARCIWGCSDVPTRVSSTRESATPVGDRKEAERRQVCHAARIHGGDKRHRPRHNDAGHQLVDLPRFTAGRVQGKNCVLRSSLTRRVELRPGDEPASVAPKLLHAPFLRFFLSQGRGT